MRTHLVLATALLLVAGAATPPARADVVHLRGGRQLVGRVVDDGDPVRLEMPGGTLSLPRTRIEKMADDPEATQRWVLVGLVVMVASLMLLSLLMVAALVALR